MTVQDIPDALSPGRANVVKSELDGMSERKKCVPRAHPHHPIADLLRKTLLDFSLSMRLIVAVGLC